MVPQQTMMISDSDLKEMLSYPWPGNVRELRNVIERAVIHAGDSSRLNISPLLTGQAAAGKAEDPLGSSESILQLAELERKYVALALKKMGNNLTQTARVLGISLNTLKKKLDSTPRK